VATIGIVGDGPGGLSAALFLAKNGHQATVFGADSTAMHFAHLRNYLGIRSIGGSEFQRVARSQVESFGARIVPDEARSIAATNTGFVVTTDAGTTTVDYVILSEGRNAPLATSLGLAATESGFEVDRNGRSSLERVYVIGRSARPGRSQAIISAGDGAAAALDIMATESGGDVTDWDSPPKD